MGNLHKADHILNLTWWFRYSIPSDFKNLPMVWVKYVFQWEKWNSEPTGNFAHTTKFLTLCKAMLSLLPLYPQMLIKEISNQTDNHKYRKNVAIKKIHSFKKQVWSFETLNSTFYAK